MTTPIHVLFSILLGIGGREAFETMHCLMTKEVWKTCFFRRNFVPVWRRAPNVCRGECHYVSV